MEDDKTILETYMCGFNNELDVKERISDLSPLLLKAYNLGALHAVVGDDVRSVDYLSDVKILDMIKSSDASIRYNKARVYSSKIVKAVLDECELNGTYKKELKKMEDEIEHNVNKRKFNINELRHIAVNFAIACEKGYKSSFDNWFNGISDEWRKIANGK
jgi:hypothetical protein